MRLKLLRRTHRDFDHEMLQRHRDLFEGGERFARNASRYLLKNSQEPADVFQKRLALARDEYTNYSGPIGNYFASWLMTSKPTFKSDPENADEFYEQFKEDCDGEGTDFEHFLRCAFVDALIDRCAHWRVEFPDQPPADAAPRDLKEWRASGAGRAVLCRVPTSNLVNWRRDHDGFCWITEYERTSGLQEFDDEDELVCEQWTIWKRDGEHCRYRIEYRASEKPNAEDDVPEVDPPDALGAIAGIPLVSLELPPELWMMNLIAGPQLSHWRKCVGQSWAIDRTCYAMPTFNVKNRRKPPTMGTGYYLMMSLEEKASYLAPPPNTYEVVEKYLERLKDEIHRVVQQMARGVDNGKSAAVGRSGQSKQSDDKQTEIVLSGFGACARAAAEKTFDMVAEGRGEDLKWHVGGMSNYNVTDAADFIASTVAAQGITIPSVTYRREVAKRVATAQLPDLDETKVQQIVDEIDENLTEEAIQPVPQDNEALPSSEPGKGGFTDELDDGAAGTEAVDAVCSQLEDDFEPGAIEWVKQAQWDGPMEVPLEQIDFSGSGSWKASKDQEKVSKFVDKISGGKRKPVILVKPPGGGKLRVADGHHRALAYQKLGQPVRAYVATVDEAAYKMAMQMHESQKVQP